MRTYGFLSEVNGVFIYLQGRGEKGDDLTRRLEAGREELEWLEAEGATRFDHVLLNDELGCEQSNFQQSLLTILQIYWLVMIMVTHI